MILGAPIEIGDRVLLEDSHGNREVECTGIDYPFGNWSPGSVIYRYTSGDPPGDGHRMYEDRWRWLASKSGEAPAGKKARPGVKVRQR
jgi:hypothetical protein